MAHEPMPGSQEEDKHADLLAMLAASRDLGPDMDKAVVESYMSRHKDDALAASGNASVVPRPSNTRLDAQQKMTLAFGALAVIAFVTILVASGGSDWWLIFLWPALGFGGLRWWGYGHERQTYRRDRMIARDEYRMERRRLRDGSRGGSYSSDYPYEFQPTDHGYPPTPQVPPPAYPPQQYPYPNQPAGPAYPPQYPQQSAPAYPPQYPQPGAPAYPPQYPQPGAPAYPPQNPPQYPQPGASHYPPQSNVPPQGYPGPTAYPGQPSGQPSGQPGGQANEPQQS